MHPVGGRDGRMQPGTMEELHAGCAGSGWRSWRRPPPLRREARGGQQGHSIHFRPNGPGGDPPPATAWGCICAGRQAEGTTMCIAWNLAPCSGWPSRWHRPRRSRLARKHVKPRRTSPPVVRGRTARRAVMDAGYIEQFGREATSGAHSGREPGRDILEYARRCRLDVKAG